MTADSRVIFATELDESGLRRGLTRLGTSVGSMAKGMGIALGAVGAGLGMLAKNGMAYNSQMEQYTTSFTTMLGGAKAAQAKVAELKDYAAKTPFEMTDLANATKTILQFGVAEERADVAMKRLGDISQGNAQKFNSLSLVYGQVASTGKLMGQDLLQMINAGFNPLQQIAQKTGASMGDLKAVMSGEKTSKEFKKMLSDAQNEVQKLGESASPAAKMLAQIGKEGMISADLVDHAMQTATEKGGLFYGAMDKQSKTASGLISTLKDNLNSLGGEAFAGLSNAAKEQAIPAALAYVDELTQALRNGGVKGLVSEAGNVLGSIVGDASAFAPQAINMAVGLIQSLVSGLKKNAPKIAKGLGETLKVAAIGMLQALPDMISMMLDIAIELVSSIADALPDLIPKLVDATFEVLGDLLGDLPRLLALGAKIIAGIMAGVMRGVQDLFGGVARLFGAGIDAETEKTRTVNVDAEVSATSKEQITTDINDGIAAATTVHDITVTVHTQVASLQENQNGATKDGSLTKKEANGIEKALNQQVDDAIKAAKEHIDEKKKEYEIALTSLVDSSGNPIYTKEDVKTLTSAMDDKVTSLTTQLDNTRTEYNTLLATIRQNGGTWTASQILELNKLLAQIELIEGKLALLQDETAQASEAKVGRVKRGVGTESDFNFAVGYEKQTYDAKVSEIDAQTNTAMATHQSVIDNANKQIDAAKTVLTNVNATAADVAKARGVIQDQRTLIDTANLAIDAAYTAGEQSKTDALSTYNDNVMALFEGMAKADPKSAEGLATFAGMVKTYAGITDDYTKIVSAKAFDPADYKTLITPENLIKYIGIDMTKEQIDTALSEATSNPYWESSLKQWAGDIFSGLTEDTKTASDNEKSNPLYKYVQSLISNGSFDGLDVTKVTGSLSDAFTGAIAMSNLKKIGTGMYGGISKGVVPEGAALTDDQKKSLREVYLTDIKDAFDIHSPSGVMVPIGESIVDGITEGITTKSTGVGTALLTPISSATSAAKTSGNLKGYSVGTNIVSGVVAGINDHAWKINVALTSAIKDAILAIWILLNMHSPSKLMRDTVGKNMMLGIEDGITENADSLTRSLTASIAESVRAGQAVLDNTLLGRVQAMTGIGYAFPSANALSASVLKGSTLMAYGASASTAQQGATIDARQTIVFESTMQAPDEIARAIRRQTTYGLAGARK